MRGVLTIIPVGDGAVSSKELAAPPALEDLQAGVGGGYIEVVPGFTRYQGKPCVAFCDEDGKRKRLPVNMRATELWYTDALIERRAQIAGQTINRADWLCGPIVIITGDRELMEEL